MANEFRASKQFLSMRHVDVARGEKVVLHDVNLQIAAGEHVAILGPNGCGKIYPDQGDDLRMLSHRPPGHGDEGIRKTIDGMCRNCASIWEWWQRSCPASAPP